MLAVAGIERGFRRQNPPLLPPHPPIHRPPSLQEGECFDAALGLASHKALVRAFFAQRAVRRARGGAWLVRWVYSLWVRLAALAAICWEWWRWGMAAPPLLAKDL